VVEEVAKVEGVEGASLVSLSYLKSKRLLSNLLVQNICSLTSDLELTTYK
jgi:hypothetical protein